jgi:hypothetical protein
MPLRRATGFPSAMVVVVLCSPYGGQPYCMAVRRVEVSAAPFLFTPQLVAWVSNA